MKEGYTQGLDGAYFEADDFKRTIRAILERIFMAYKWEDEVNRLTWKSLFGEKPETALVAQHQFETFNEVLDELSNKYPGAKNISDTLKKRVENLYSQLQLNDPVLQVQHPDQKTLDSISEAARKDAKVLSLLLNEEINNCDAELNDDEKVETATVNALQKYVQYMKARAMALLFTNLDIERFRHISNEEIVSTYMRNFYEYLFVQGLPEKYLGIVISNIIKMMYDEISRHTEGYEGVTFRQIHDEISETRASYFVASYYSQFFNSLSESFDTDRELINAAQKDLHKLAKMFKNAKLEYDDFAKMLHQTIALTISIITDDKQLKLLLGEVERLLKNQISILKRAAQPQDIIFTYLTNPQLANIDAKGLGVISGLLMEIQRWANMMRKYKLENLATFMEYAMSIFTLQFAEVLDAVLSGILGRKITVCSFLTNKYYLGLNSEELQIFEAKPYMILAFVSKFAKLIEEESMNNKAKTRNVVQLSALRIINRILSECVRPAQKDGIPQNWLMRFVSETWYH